MYRYSSILSTLFFATPILILSIVGYSQTTANSFAAQSNVVGSVPAVKQAINSNLGENDFGSVVGRVLYERDVAVEGPLTDLDGIAGVKVLARRVNAGFGNFYFERLSGEDGTFEFKYLRPGEYEIEIERTTLPNAFPAPQRRVSTVAVEIARRTRFDIRVTPQRAITGFVYIDTDGDGAYKPGKDLAVAGATVTANGAFAVSDEKGAYVLRDLPPGRIALLVASPIKNENIHVVLDVGDGPLTNRILNIPMSH